MQSCLSENGLVHAVSSRDAVVLFINDELVLSDVFLNDDESFRPEVASAKSQKLRIVVICQMVGHPLNPNAVVFFLKGEILYTHAVHLSHLLHVEKVQFGLCKHVFALLQKVHFFEHFR